MVFWFDIGINFFTAFYDIDHLVCENLPVALRYLKGWFVLDFLSAFPFDALSDSKVSKLLKVHQAIACSRR